MVEVGVVNFGYNNIKTKSNLDKCVNIVRKTRKHV